MQVTLSVNVGLTIFKFIAGILGLSKALVADALHSFSDILTTVVAYVGVLIGERPADEDHPYGHGNAETIAAGLMALIILIVGAYAGTSAVLALIHKQFRTPLTIALFAVVVSIVIKELLFRYTIKVGKLSNSPAIVADAWHHRSDVYSSIAALVGIAGAKISFLYLDPLAGLVVSILIVRIGIRLIRSNVNIMMDARPQQAFLNRINSIVEDISGVKKVDSIKVHRRGSEFTIDIEIAVASNIAVEAGHMIATTVRNKLRRRVRNINDVMVHVNPYKSGR